MANATRFDASLLFSVDDLLAQVETGLNVIETESKIEVYEIGASAEEFDDRLVMTIHTEANGGTIGILRHSTSEGTWTFANRSEIDQFIRDAVGETSLADLCDILGNTDEEIEAEAEEATGLTYAERVAAYREAMAD